MAETESAKTTTDLILKDIENEFKEIKKDLDDVKAAISETGVVASTTTTGLANNVKTISAKVEEKIKAAEVVNGLAGGNVNINKGFIYPSSTDTLDHNSIGVIPGLTTYTVPEDKDYLIPWPTKTFMEKVPADKRNITIEFSKRHLGQLCNTNYRMSKYDLDSSKDNTYELNVNITDDRITFKKFKDMSEEDKTMLYEAQIIDDGEVVECTGTVSLPDYKSNFTINGKGLTSSVLKCDQFIVSFNPSVNAIITDTIIMDEELILRSRHAFGYGGMENVLGMSGRGGSIGSTACKIYVPKGSPSFTIINSTLNPENQYVKNNISKISKYATIANNRTQYFTLIAVDPTDEMTAFLMKEAANLAKLSISVVTYDYSKYFDFCALEWLENKGKAFTYKYQHWFEYLTPTEEDYNYYMFDNDDTQTTFKNYSPTSHNAMVTITDARSLQYANTESGQNVYLLGDGESIYHNGKNTVIIPNAKYKWDFLRAVQFGDGFPFDGNETSATCENLTSDGRNIYTLNIFNDDINTLSVYPLVDFYKNNVIDDNNAQLDLIIEADNGYDEDTKTFKTIEKRAQFYLESDYRAKLKYKKHDESLVDIEHLIVTNEVPVGGVPNKFSKFLPYFYNESIKTIKGTDITLVPFRLEAKQGKVTGITKDEPAVPANPMEIILDGNCAVSAWKGGLYYDRTGKHHIITPEKAEYNAKYVHILVDETNPIVASVNACRYRLALFTKDKTKRYNYTTKTWEEVASYTGDTATFAELFPTEFAKLTDVVEV